MSSPNEWYAWLMDKARNHADREWLLWALDELARRTPKLIPEIFSDYMKDDGFWDNVEMQIVGREGDRFVVYLNGFEYILSTEEILESIMKGVTVTNE